MTIPAAIDFSSFARGELSPRLKGRSDYAGYYAGLETCLNMVVLPQGGVTRRPGTLYVGLAKDQTDTPFQSRPVRFIFSTVQAYMLVFTATNIRVYMNDAPVLSGGNPVDIVSPYSAADLPYLNFVQSADTLYIFGGLCPGNSGMGYAVRTLTRSSHTSWTLATPTFLDGPYLPNVPAATNTLTPAGTTGSITLTAANTTGINKTPSNPGQGFLSTDVGRMVRIQQTNWAWCLITAVTDTTHVTATVQAAAANGANGSLDGTTASVNFALGKWSNTTGYPYVGMFFQNRLMACGTDNQPNAAEGSVSADFLNFAATQKDNTVQSNNAISWVISDDQVNAIRWLAAAGSAAAQQLGLGTSGGENILQPATTAQALSSTNVQVYRETDYGGLPVGVATPANWPAVSNPGAIRIGKAVLFWDQPGRKLREWQWAWAVNGYLGPDRTVDAEHVSRSTPNTLPGIIQMARQQHPHDVLWCVRGDGQLVALTYLPEQQIVAWHRHTLGGQYYGGPPIVEGVAAIPSQDGTYSELWLTVLRTVAGTPTRTVEVMTRFFDGAPAENAFFVDCGALSALTQPAATLSMSAASGKSVTFTASAAIFAAGNVNSLLRVNQGVAVVRSFTDTTHVVGDWYIPAATTRSATSGTWSLTATGTTATGLTWLNGETVQMLGDGADMGTGTVAAGSATMNGSASLVAAGLPITYDLVTMPFVPRQAVMSVAGKVKRIDHLYLRLHECLEAFSFGQKRTDALTGQVDHPSERLETRTAADKLGRAPALASLLRRVPMPGGSDLEAQIEITGSGPFPLTVLAIGAKAEIGEMPERGIA